MRAITVHEPWATLIAEGHKTIETRSWPTSYRGPIAIHAGRHWDHNQQEISEQEWPIADVLPTNWTPALGCVIAVAELFDCRQVGKELARQIDARLADAEVQNQPSEYHYGLYTAGRWMWILRNVRKVEPIPARGMQGLWEWDESGLVVAL